MPQSLRTQFLALGEAYLTSRIEQLAAERLRNPRLIVPNRSIVIFINEERERQGLTYTELNRRAGYSKSQLSNMLGRRQRVTIEVAEAYLNPLGFTLAIAPQETYREK